MAGEAGPGAGASGHITTDAELAGAPPPPFLGWTGVYLIVLGALAAQVAIYAALTAIFR